MVMAVFYRVGEVEKIQTSLSTWEKCLEKALKNASSAESVDRQR